MKRYEYIDRKQCMVTLRNNCVGDIVKYELLIAKALRNRSIGCMDKGYEIKDGQEPQEVQALRSQIKSLEEHIEILDEMIKREDEAKK